MERISARDVDELALGAAVLGAGGGDATPARQILAEVIEEHGPVSVIAAADLDPDDLVLPLAILPRPVPARPGQPPPGTPRRADVFPGIHAASQAVLALQNHLRRRVAAVLPLALGGVDALFPLAAAGGLELPCLDADGGRRGVPRLGMTLFSLAGLAASPLSVADATGNGLVIDAADNATGERLARAAVAELGAAAVVAAYPLTAAQCQEHTNTGSLSYCLEIGRRVRAVYDDAPGARAGLLSSCGAQTIFEGTIADVVRHTVDGRLRGTATLEHLGAGDRLLRVDFQTENLVATENGMPVATTPDVIAMIDAATGQPISTYALTPGRRVDVLVVPAGERWRGPAGARLAGPRAFGYDLDYVRWAPTV